MEQRMKFERIGGALQPVIRNAEDMKKILTLDPALWSVMSMTVDCTTADPEFLRLMDTDHNGKIRLDEVKAAVTWLLNVLKSYDGVNSTSDELQLREINRNNEEGKRLFDSSLLILLNLKKEKLLKISMEDVVNREKIFACGLRNGDGVIPVELIPDPELIPFAEMVVSVSGKNPDLCGLSGFTRASLESFLRQASAWLAWIDEGKEESLYAYGAKTAELFQLCEELTPKMEEFFRFCEAVAMFGKTPSAGIPDIMNSAAMEEVIRKAPAAEPNVDGVLFLDGKLNPLWREKLLTFFAGVIPGETRVTKEIWKKILERFMPFRNYLARKPAEVFDKTDPEYLRSCFEQNFPERLSALIDSDLIFEDTIKAVAKVRQLLLFQKNMLPFLNNFVSLRMLFLRQCLSIYQVGDLVMDGRTFRMVTKITSVAEHKKIAERSNICILYIEATTGPDATAKKILLAAAVTDGGMNQLFIGKRGVFITPDQVVWDAKVIDYLLQPVSISEALKTPFYKFGDFLGKQADRFFSSKSKEFEQNVSKEIGKASAPVSAAKPVQTPAVSGSMMLMGGGVGLAALGSAVAFIAQSIKKVSFWDIVAVFAGILLIFGGPIIAVSLVKLYRRSISVFLEASGLAMNKRMRISHAMGKIFTTNPIDTVPPVLQKIDLVKQYLNPKKKKRSFFWLWVILAVISGALIGFGIWLWLLIPYIE